MSTNNHDIAEIFYKTADLLELQGQNIYRIRAYRNAGNTIENLSQSISDMVKKGEDLTQLPGIGEDLANKIKNIVKTGKFELLTELEKNSPDVLTQMMKISGLGPKRVKEIYDELKITSIDNLAQAAADHKISTLPGFSEKTEENILDEIKRIKKAGKRILLSVADKYAIQLVEYLKKDKNIQDIKVAGSYRRKMETVGDIDILVTSEKCSEIMDRFVNYEDVLKVISKGDTRSTVLLKSDLQVDLRVVPKKSYGAALIYFTGSKSHNIAIRRIAIKNNWKINEYGVFEEEKFVAGNTEEEIYKKLGLQYIEPELRENRGEIEAAEKNQLPKLIELADIKGDLHTHTRLTDGRHTLEEMVEAARKKGYQYIANTEHSKHLTVARGLDERKLTEQIKRIDKINENLNDFVVLKGVEVDILEDGSLDISDKILKELDIVVCSVHFKFNLPREKQTNRILRAMDNKYFNVLAHPTGRLINKRKPYDIDLEKIMEAAKERDCILELNAHPERLDLNDIYCKTAKEMGIKIAISTDSHSIDGYYNMKYGVGQARRGWLEAANVINTKSLEDLRNTLKKIQY